MGGPAALAYFFGAIHLGPQDRWVRPISMGQLIAGLPHCERAQARLGDPPHTHTHTQVHEFCAPGL